MIGTLGVLVKAKREGLIPVFLEVAEAMREQGIYYSRGLVERIGKHLGEL